MTFTTAKQITDHPVHGNYFEDAELWTACDRIIQDDSIPLELRVAASKKVDEIVGETCPDWETLPDAERVAKHKQVLNQMEQGTNE